MKTLYLILIAAFFFLLQNILFSQQITVTLGTGSSSNSTAAPPTPYGTFNKSHRQQYLIFADELQYNGLAAGNITALAFNVANINNCSPMVDFMIRIKHTNTNWFYGIFEYYDYTTVFGPQTFMPVNGWNTHNFSTPFNWDGVSNIIIDVCFGENTINTQNASVYYTPTPNVNTSQRYQSSTSYTCNTTMQATMSYNRANMKITGQKTSCWFPHSLAASDITDSSALLLWGVGGNETTWHVKIVEHISNTTVGIFTVNNAPEYSAQQLNHNTVYACYVQAVCNTNDTSNWIGPHTFKTFCTTASPPFFEGFESSYVHNTAVGECWKQQSVTGSSPWTANNVFANYYRAPRSGNWNIFLQSNNEDWLFHPFFLNGGTSYTFEMYARQDYFDTTKAQITVAYGSKDSAAYMTDIIIPQTNIQAQNYQLLEGIFTPASSGIYYIGVKGKINSPAWFLSIDDISVYETPPCPGVGSSITAYNPTNTGFDLSWTVYGNATEWHIEYGQKGFIQGTGTLITTNTTPYIIGGLMPLTLYDAYIRSICAVGDTSVWRGPVTIKTSCPDYFSSQFIEDFAGIQAGNIPECWTRTHPNWERRTGNSAGGISPEMVFKHNPSANGTFMLVTPIIDVANKQFLDVLFKHAVNHFDTAYGIYSLSVWSSTDGGNTWNSEWTVSPTSDIPAEEIHFSLQPDSIVQIAWVYTGTSFAIRFWYIDDIGILTCAPVKNLSATGITHSDAVLQWQTYNTHSFWNLLIVEALTQDTVFYGDVNDTVYTLNGLMPDTEYMCFVQTDCENGDLSSWSEPYEFRTTQILATLPFYEDFEVWPNNWTVVNGTQTNQWHIGSDVAYTGLQSAYISNDSNSNVYTINNRSAVHLYRDIVFPDTNHTINLQFYWKDMGGSSAAMFDFLGVTIMSPTIFPIAGDFLTLPYLGQFNMQSEWQHVSIFLPAGVYANNTWRLVFTWRNNFSISDQPPVAIDDISITLNEMSVHEQQKDNTFELFPNPNNGIFYILPKYDVYKAKIRVFNAQGQIVYNKELEELSIQAPLRIDLEDKTQGIYFLQIFDNRNVFHKKLIVY